MKLTKLIKSSILATAMLALPATTFAEEESSTDLQISGVIDASFSLVRVNSSKPFGVGFSIDQVEIDLEKNWEKVGFRFDLEAGAGWNGSGADISYGLEQGYMSVNFNDTIGMKIGTWLAPIGWESLDAPDMYQYSHAMVFDYGLPTAHTGLLLSVATGSLDAVFYLTNGMDTYYEIDNAKGAGTRIGYAVSDSFNFGVSYLYNHADVMIADLDLTVETDSILLGGEFNFGLEDATSDSWFGGLATVNFGLSDAIALTLRGDVFKDTATGSRVGGAGNEFYVNGTLSPSISLAENAGMLLEYKATYATKASTVDHLLALESTYSF